VDYRYDNKIIFKALSLSIKQHAITTIIGPNGSGKSTFLQLLAGYLTPRNGAIYLDGMILKDYKKKVLAKKLSAVHQKSTAPMDFSVREVVSYGRYSYRQPFEKDVDGEAVIERVLQQLNLNQYADTAVHALSGGEMQRVFIAMSLVQEPEVLLLDEPTTFLDLQYQYQVLDMIKELKEKQNLTIIMVLHDINQALMYSDEIVCIESGEIVAQGPPEKVVTQKLLKDVYHIDAKIIHDQECGLLIGQFDRR